MNPPGYLEQFRAGVVSYLQNFSEFEPLSTWVDGSIPTVNGIQQSAIVQKIRGNFDSILQQAVNRVGVVVMVEIMGWSDSGSQTNEMTFDPVRFCVEVQEQTTINAGAQGSGLSALFLMERIHAALKQWTPPTAITGGTYPIVIPRSNAKNITTAVEIAQGLDHWNADFEIKITTDTRTTEP